ncbi:dicer-like 4 isoform X2 [Wolffia australiana]
MAEETESSTMIKDPRVIARRYQLDLSKRAVEENIIVHLGTGSGKTHIAVLLMYELRHTIKKPSKDVCVFLAPTLPLIEQQASYIRNTTNFKVRCCSGNSKRWTHDSWKKEMDDTEVFVMTPQILIDKLRHCFIKMELVALLIFDECHHAQLDKRHPYAQIMKEFYETESRKRPRIFGMTASPIIGKGGSNKSNYAKCVNSLETLLDAKVCSVDGYIELESVIASPDVKVYYYEPSGINTQCFHSGHFKRLEEIKLSCTSMGRQKISDLTGLKRKMRLLSKTHANLVFCLEHLGLYGAVLACGALLTGETFDTIGTDLENSADNSLVILYLERVTSAFSSDPLIGEMARCRNFCPSDASMEPFFSNKLFVVIQILKEFSGGPNAKCIIFVKRIIVASTLARILSSMKSLDFWKCEFLVGVRSKTVTRRGTNDTVDKFCRGEVNLLVATAVAEEGLDIRTCSFVVRFDPPETVASYIQSRGRARMQRSEYVLLVEKGNQRQEKLLENLMSGEKVMNEEVKCRSTDEVFDNLEETTYRVETGACISTGCSVSLLHHYCAKLPRDEFFIPVPKFFFREDSAGIICCIYLPPNCPIHQVEGPPSASKQDAKRAACLKACIELHSVGALTDYLLPATKGKKEVPKEGLWESDSEEGEYQIVGNSFYEIAVPEVLSVPQKYAGDHVTFIFYLINFNPIPPDREYKGFGLFVTKSLTNEVESMKVELCLTHRRIVEAGLVHSGSVIFDDKMICSAQKYQEMFHKVIFDRSKFFAQYVPLGDIDIEQSLCPYYLLLPVIQGTGGEIFIDWTSVECCLSSPVFHSTVPDKNFDSMSSVETLTLVDGPVEKKNVIGSLVYTPHSKRLFFVDDILHETNAYNQMRGCPSLTYEAHYIKRFKIHLAHPTQPLLKAKELFPTRNLLHNHVRDGKEVRVLEEQVVELPPELCCLKIKGFSKDVGRALSLLPSFMHRLENFLLAAQLKDIFASSFPEGSGVSAFNVLQALTTEKSLQGFSLERLEILGDAFLKYAVGRHFFLSYSAVDEGQLSTKRSNIVNNSYLCRLAIQKNLQVYIHNEPFDPSHFFTLGPYSEATFPNEEAQTDDVRVIGKRMYCFLTEKAIADVVEALVGAFLIDSGFRAACAFLRWIGMPINNDASSVHRLYKESFKNLSPSYNIDVSSLEEILGYTFRYKGILAQAFIHPSFNKHLGSCYQRLEFLGDSVLDYLIISYFYSTYPDLKPGQLSDLKSLTVNNVSFAHVAISLSLHEYLIHDSPPLTEAIKKFQLSSDLVGHEKDPINDPGCPKVLGDLVESCIAAVLLDSGFDLNCVWEIVLKILNPILSLNPMQVNPLRELRELCQCRHLGLTFSPPVAVQGKFLVEVTVTTTERTLTCSAIDLNSKVARTLASKKALTKLKALGFRGKSKSLEEMVRDTRKKSPGLIGFDETPILGCSMEEMVEPSDPSSLPDVAHKLIFASGASKCKNGEKEEEITPSTKLTPVQKPPTARLFEACAVNYWKPPTFSCYAEGNTRFRCKVSIKVDVGNGTVIECFGEFKPRKQLAKDSASEAALWCLSNMDLIS